MLPDTARGAVLSSLKRRKAPCYPIAYCLFPIAYSLLPIPYFPLYFPDPLGYNIR